MMCYQIICLWRRERWMLFKIFRRSLVSQLAGPFHPPERPEVSLKKLRICKDPGWVLRPASHLSSETSCPKPWGRWRPGRCAWAPAPPGLAWAALLKCLCGFSLPSPMNMLVRQFCSQAPQMRVIPTPFLYPALASRISCLSQAWVPSFQRGVLISSVP